MHHCQARHCGGFSLYEVIASLALVAILLALLVPALSSARVIAQRDGCANNLQRLGKAMEGYLNDHDRTFPFVPGLPSWHYGGLRYSATDGSPYLDMNRPLNRWLTIHRAGEDVTGLFCCPADYGIVSDIADLASSRRSACRAFGTSYRANPNLFDVREAGMSDDLRGLRTSEITMAPSRLVVMGDAVWYEQLHDTGREASWHREKGHGNLLFLDGAVRFQAMMPRPEVGPAVIEPFVERGDAQQSAGIGD